MDLVPAGPEELGGLVVCHVASVLSVYLQDLVSLAQLLPDWLHLRHKQSHGIASDDFETEPFWGAGDDHVSGLPADVRRGRKEREGKEIERERLVHLLSKHTHYTIYRTYTLVHGATSRCMLCKPLTTVITCSSNRSFKIWSTFSYHLHHKLSPIVHPPAGLHAEKVWDFESDGVQQLFLRLTAVQFLLRELEAGAETVEGQGGGGRRRALHAGENLDLCTGPRGRLLLLLWEREKRGNDNKRFHKRILIAYLYATRKSTKVFFRG